MNIGIIGTSFILPEILPQMKATGMTLGAVYSRKEETGRALADTYGIPAVYTSLETLLADPSLDWIYVCSPNSLHYEQSKAALEAGKNVLCEKPLVPSLAQARELAGLAKSKGLFLFEAVTTAFHPNYQIIRQRMDQLGDLKMVLCTFCQYSSRYQALLDGKNPNVFNPQFAGGALMDLNLYNIHFAVGLLGAPVSVKYLAKLHSNGIDTHGIALLEYPGFFCQCAGAKDGQAQNQIQIVGEKGYMKITPSASNCQCLEICLRGQEPEIFQCPENGWYYEMEALARMVKEKDLEGCYRLLDTSCQVVRVLEAARKDAGLPF